MKNVMLLGDSIRLGYQPEVIRELGAEFDVWGPKDNCRFAKYTLNELDRIFNAYGRIPDVIHWNNGLWDSAIICTEDGMFTPPDEYERYMILVLRELRKRCSILTFATTTPIKAGCLNQRLEHIQTLNHRIIPVMIKEGVPVNDLYTFVESEVDKMICDDKIHLTEYGYQKVGEKVADFIRTNMK